MGSDELPYSILCEAFEKIESTTKRLVISNILTNFFAYLLEFSPSTLLPSVYLCINKLAPAYEGLELGLGESILMKAVSGATGRPMSTIKSEVDKLGDLGMVAQQSKSKQSMLWKPKPLTINGVFKTFKEIAKTTGGTATQKKIDKVKGLIAACQNNESKYLVRSLEGKLRIGLAEQSVLISLAAASEKFLKKSENRNHICNENKPDEDETEMELSDASEILKAVYNEIPNYDIVIANLIEYGVYELPKYCKLTPGIPLKPMLAHPTKSITEVLDRFNQIPFTCEYKYDGERAQLHMLENGNIQIYSRNSENMTEKYPDLPAKVQHAISAASSSVSSFVLDCEVVAWDLIQKKILPFQILSTRKRKDVSVESISVQVCLFAFDLIYLNGKSLLKQSLAERRKLLHEHFGVVENEFQFATFMDSTAIEDIESFLEEAIQAGCEGLMIKTMDASSSYEPSKRSRNWLKVKKDYVNGTGDSLDLVVIGGYVGRGKRVGVYGGYLLACYDPTEETFQAICKLGTGFSESDLEAHAAFFKDKIINQSSPRSYIKCTDSIKPDVWFEPVQVWEIKAADLSISPIYTAAVGIVDPSKGISLRFPRFLRIRTDKSPEDATTSEQVAEMFRSQQQQQQQNSSALSATDDFEY